MNPNVKLAGMAISSSVLGIILSQMLKRMEEIVEEIKMEAK